MTFELATLPDLLRLATVPVFGYAAWYDHRTRTAPRVLWPPLVGLGLVLLPFAGLEGGLVVYHLSAIAVIVALAVLLHRYRSLGAADAKALVAIALLFPTAPEIAVAGLELPLAAFPFLTLSTVVLAYAAMLSLLWPVTWALQGRLEDDVEELTVPFLVPLFAGLLLAVTVSNPAAVVMPS